jgi:protein O-GlcNAc transferase
VAASLLTTLQLPELIVPSLEAYEERAFQLATSPVLAAELRAKLANRLEHNPLFDTARFTRHLELAYSSMWEIYQRGGSPESYPVQA